MLIKRYMFYLAPDTGDGNGGNADPDSGNGMNPDEAEAMRKELDELRKEKAEREKKAEEERQARMSEEEKAKAAIEKERAAVLSEYRVLQLQGCGLDEEYSSLITGSTADEIKASGELLRKLIDKVRAETEAEVKKGISRTKAPGSGDSRSAATDEDYYREVLNGGK